MPLRYDMFVKAYSETREHGGINGLTPSEKFLQTFNIWHNRNNTKQKSVTYVGIWKCHLSM
ncbi:MAG: hypothetical protein WA667_09710 [Candidatus Nitrosopolaris sp.]